MTVRQLIAILSTCPQDLPIATHADNHTHFGKTYPVRVALLSTYAGQHVVIGNLSKRALNPPNWFVTKELDGAKPLNEEWP